MFGAKLRINQGSSTSLEKHGKFACVIRLGLRLVTIHYKFSSTVDVTRVIIKPHFARKCSIAFSTTVKLEVTP